MKNLFFIAIVLLLMTSCQQKKESETKSLMKTASSSSCIDLTDYEKLETTAEKVIWLQEFGEIVCKSTLDSAVIAAHEIDKNTVQSTHPVAFSLRWKKLKKFVQPNFYNAYLSFDFNGSSDVTAIKLIPEFNENSASFSIPLIMAIGKEDKLTDDSFVEFRVGAINNINVLLIITKDENNVAISYYDTSNNPI